MADIVEFKTRTPLLQGGEPSADVISRLEELLAAARTGHVQMLLYVAVAPDEVLTHGYVGEASCHVATAGATYLQHMVVQDSREQP